MNVFAYRVITPQGENWNSVNMDHVINASVSSEDGYTIGIRLITTAATTKEFKAYPQQAEIDANGMIRLHKTGAQKVKYDIKEIQSHFMPLINHPEDAARFAEIWGIPVGVLNFKPNDSEAVITEENTPE